MSENRVLTCKIDNRVTLESRTKPHLRDGEILVRLRACGICGTDIAKVYDPYFVKPVQLGHELVATVVESKTEQFKMNDRVAIAHHAPNYNSHYTKRGSAPMDPQFKRSNIDPAGFAEFIRIPELLTRNTVILIPDHVPDSRAVFMEPLACCLRAIDRVSLLEGDTALIVGAGAVGILFLPLLRDLKVKSLVLDMREERLTLSNAWGAAESCIANKIDTAEFAKRHTEGRGVDIVILSVFTKHTIATAMQTVRDGGTILVFGSKPENEIPVDWWDIWRREINLITSYSATPDLMPRAMDLLSREDYALETLISHQFPLPEAQQAFDLVHEGKASKAIITL
jgi:L-iditol 2-dehydrogenase